MKATKQANRFGKKVRKTAGPSVLRFRKPTKAELNATAERAGMSRERWTVQHFRARVAAHGLPPAQQSLFAWWPVDGMGREMVPVKLRRAS